MTSLDTSTDSNTRERLPYEADGLITGDSRIALQREFAWPKHSWRHNTWNPTWPTEWRQSVSLFALREYMLTGEFDLVDSFAASLLNQTQIGCIAERSTGLVDYGACPHQSGGMGVQSKIRDIVDWPEKSRDGYVMGDINTVVNAYAIAGIRALARLGRAGGGASGGLPAHVEALEAQVKTTALAVNALCTNATSGLYYDGYDAAKKAPIAHSAWHAQVFPAAFGLAPEVRWPSILAFLKEKGMAGSVYAAYWALKAAYNMDVDHGALALQLLTSCDENSWCHMLNVGATAVMEAWSRREKPNLSWSHPWASAPASAVVWGFFGITPTTPGFRTFVFKPQPGSVASASIKVPTLSGNIVATLAQTPGTAFAVTLAPPPGTRATVCLPKLALATTTLVVDGIATQGYAQRDYVCVDGIGSAQSSRKISRTLEASYHLDI